MMIFGAHLENLPSGEVRLLLKTPRSRWRSFAWALTVFEAQDDAWDFLRLKLDYQNDTIRGITPSTPFLKYSHSRWYEGGHLCFPVKVEITPELLTFWLVRTLAEGGRALKFVGMGEFHAMDAADRVERLTGWVGGSEGGKVPLNVPEAEAWLKQRVPASVWSR